MIFIDEKKKRICHIIIFIIFIVISYMAFCKIKSTVPVLAMQYRFIIINQTNSIPMGLYIRIPTWYLHNGDYVIYQPVKEVEAIAVQRGWMTKGQLFLKRIAALEGETFNIDLDKSAFYANGRYLGQIYTTDGTGKEMPIYNIGEKIVPKGYFLPYGMNPKSYDGRYTGYVPTENIYFKLVPVFTL